MNMPIRTRLSLAIAAALGLHGIAAHAQLIINDTLTGASSSYDWQHLNGACLTAGDGTGSIPACVGLPYYSGKTQVGGTSGRLPDAVGAGALRLSNGDFKAGTNGNNETGAVVSNFTFPTNEGIQVTWTSVSYGGNNYNGTGADGISFFLSDGTIPATLGAFGGSLGYSCANGKDPSDGVIGAYIGIGIDEFGNFANAGDNTDTGVGFDPGRISVRGAGSTAWSWLHNSATYKKYYTGSTPNATAVQNTCKTGYAWNYSGSNKTDSTGATIKNGKQTNDKLAYNYPLLYSVDVPTALANQQAVNKPTRGAAVPIIFSLKITADGLLDFSYSVAGGATQTVTSGLSITASNGPLPASFRFGFSSGTGGGSNVHEITCFKATPANVSNTSAGSNVQQSGKIMGGSQVFLAYYHPVNWWGSLTANYLVYDAANDLLSASTTVNWDANCVLTGGTCQATGGNTVTAQGPSARTILTWNNSTTGGAGIPFEWDDLTTTQQTSLGTSDRLDYLRGGRSKEVSNSGTLRNRTSVLGDIYDSSPVWVGPPNFDYNGPWTDKLYGGTLAEGSTYSTFASDNASRMGVVYVGSNDGMLHAFQAGTPATSGSSPLTSNDGTELLAYMPGQVVNAIHTSTSGLDFSSTQYAHNFYVDSTPGTGDLYYGNQWHTWVVSGLGVGGHPGGPVNSNSTAIAAPVSALFALDVTDPSSTTFAESNASTVVLGEWTSATITCATNATCGTNFGQTLGTPLIRRLHDGTWGVIWGNGTNSASGRAGIFIMHVAADGTRTFQYIDAGPGPGNGIVQISSADLDSDHVTDFIYAGDVNGNLWRFDLTAATSATWDTAVTNLFTTSTGQPITVAPQVSAIPAANSTGRPKVLISFGTGQKLPLTQTAAEVWASGTQSLYGIWDANLTAWNATATDTKYDALSTSPGTLSPADLTTQTITNVAGSDGYVYRTVTSHPVCWKGATTSGCSTHTKLGWQVDLPGTNEQDIYDPVQVEDSFVVNTTIPQVSQPLTCGNTPATGFTMALDLTNGGGGLNAPLSPNNSSSANSSGTGTFYSGVGFSGTGTASLLIAGDKYHLGMEKNDGTYGVLRYNFTGGKVSSVTWTKLR